MVVALKEVKIRGEIRTTVDYCVEMIQSPDFVGNNIHTGWLDARISSHVRAPCSLPSWPPLLACAVSPVSTEEMPMLGTHPHLSGSLLSLACIKCFPGSERQTDRTRMHSGMQWAEVCAWHPWVVCTNLR